MSATLYIVIEGEDPGFDTFVNGRLLAQAEDTLSRLAERLGVRPLLDFFSADADSMALLQQEGFEFPIDRDRLLPTQWFSPEEGLETVSALHAYLAMDPEYLGVETGEAQAELDEYRVVLEKAAARRLRWHLAVSWR